MINFTHEKETAIKFSLYVSGDVSEYAMSLLHIINNARENKSSFYKVENTSSNLVYVVCNPDDKEAVRKYLENFGEIKFEDEVNYIVIQCNCDLHGYEELWDKDDVFFKVE